MYYNQSAQVGHTRENVMPRWIMGRVFYSGHGRARATHSAFAAAASSAEPLTIHKQCYDSGRKQNKQTNKPGTTFRVFPMKTSFASELQEWKGNIGEEANQKAESEHKQQLISSLKYKGFE